MHDHFDSDLRDTIQFHGHLCPGLALGYRVAKAALRELKTGRQPDEGLVAVVENDSCAADAVQFITGATFGKGNLIFRDYGKHVYTFYNRATGRAIRISEDFHGFAGEDRYGEIRKRQEAGEDVSVEMQQFKMEKAAAILNAAEKDIFSISPVAMPTPEPARIRKSLRCVQCGDKFMESRGRVKDGVIVCIPCFEKG